MSRGLRTSRIVFAFYPAGQSPDFAFAAADLVFLILLVDQIDDFFTPLIKFYPERFTESIFFFNFWFIIILSIIVFRLD